MVDYESLTFVVDFDIASSMLKTVIADLRSASYPGVWQAVQILDPCVVDDEEFDGVWVKATSFLPPAGADYVDPILGRQCFSNGVWAQMPANASSDNCMTS